MQDDNNGQRDSGQQNYWQQPQQEPPAPVVAPVPVPVPAPIQVAPVSTPIPSPTPDPIPAADPVVNSPVSPIAVPPVDEAPDNTMVAEEVDNASDDILTWTAAERTSVARSPLWFILFFAVVLALAGVSIFFLKSWSFTLLIVVMAVAFAVYVLRPPEVMTYSLSMRQGLYVGEKLHPFAEFKAFGVIKDGNENIVMFLPRKRFAPSVTALFPTEVGERLVDIAGQILPMESVKLDVVDLIVRKLRM